MLPHIPKSRKSSTPKTTATVLFPVRESSRNISGWPMDRRVQRAILDVQKSILITTKQMADSANLSVDHFSRLFKKETGVSLHRYRKNVRLERARVFLESSELSIKELSTRAGFRDQSHFVRDFKKAYGLFPMRYRIHWRKINHSSNNIGNQRKDL